MLSVLMQVLTIVCVAALVWFALGLFDGLHLDRHAVPALFGGLDKAFLAGRRRRPRSRRRSRTASICPNTCSSIFQMTFACITPALIVGAFAERMKFTPLILFVVAWLTLAYFPIAHMVWYWAGPDFLPRRADRLRPAVGHGARSTSPAAPWSTSTPASPAWSAAS